MHEGTRVIKDGSGRRMNRVLTASSGRAAFERYRWREYEKAARRPVFSASLIRPFLRVDRMTPFFDFHGFRLLLLALCFGLLVHSAAAQQRPADFTPEERALFVEADPKPIPRALAQAAPHGSVAAWIDADHVLYSTREIAGVWKADLNEPAKLVIFDVRARTVQAAPYEGNLVCFSADRLLVAVPRFLNSSGFSPRTDTLMSASRFGAPLKHAEDATGKDILPFSCALNPVLTRLADGTEVTEVPLLPGDGFLRWARSGYHAAEGIVSGYDLFDAAGRLVRSSRGRGRPLQTRLYYVPWLGAYFSDKATTGNSEYIWPDGRQIAVQPPQLLASFAASNNVGSAAAIPVRPGVLWHLVTWRGFWRMQGLYLQPATGKLRRIDAGHAAPQPRPTVSPDGCEIFYFRRDGDPLNARTPLVPTVTNVCEGDFK